MISHQTVTIKLFIVILSLFFFIFPTASRANKLNTSYLSVEIPPHWSCKQIQSNWFCKPNQGPEEKSIHLIVSAKEASPEDTLSSMKRQLEEPKTLNIEKHTISSTFHWLKEISLSQHLWIQSLQFNREIENFFSYYLITIIDQMNMLLLLNVEKNKVQLLQPTIEMITQSIHLNNLSSHIKPVVPQPISVCSTQPTESSTLCQPVEFSSESWVKTLFHPKILFGIIIGLALLLIVWLQRKK
ncbi:MAG: hypothetical protein K1X29_02100 [Bdellovibrionales bacterium]|nr:hypothetical protein [Bdellovibrionales bacterium]